MGYVTLITWERRLDPKMCGPMGSSPTFRSRRISDIDAS